jgi:hypothetical protein
MRSDAVRVGKRDPHRRGEGRLMWSYSQSTGAFVSPAGTQVGTGYSGNGAGLNNPLKQDVEGVGPIPQGVWTIGGFFDDQEKGPIVAHLTPADGTETFGRSGFMVHGDNQAMDRSASEGCIILPRAVRSMVMASDDRALTVTA